MLTIGFSEFDKIRKEINRITHNARSISSKVKMAASYNLFAYFLDNEKYPQKPLEADDGLLSRVITRSASHAPVSLSKSERSGLLKAVKENSRELAKQDKYVLLKLHSDIELVTLSELIEKYQLMLSKNLNEDKWQAIFSENPFILNMAFGYPVVKIQDQASVGGRKISGSGDKVTDYIVKNNITNNTAIFEIKTPQTKLLNLTPYRDGVYTPSKELSGAVNQVLDQKYKFQKEISVIKDNSGLFDIESYSVHCALIIGVVPSNRDHQKSLELFRRNSKDVEVITFDELFEKLKQLYAFLSADEADA